MKKNQEVKPIKKADKNIQKEKLVKKLIGGISETKVTLIIY